MSMRKAISDGFVSRRVPFCRATMAAFVVAGLLATPVMGQQSKGLNSVAPREPGMPLRFMLSGHSLTDNPLPEYIAAIGASQGHPTTWNQQNIVGSPIRCRTQGCGSGSGPWFGYRQGKNRNDRRNMDVAAELREKRGANGYDTLIVAEGHHSLAVIRGHDTVRYLRQFHELLIAGNPEGTTYLYEPWEGIKDLSNPTPWVALEREATKTWGCVTTRVNQSLAHEGRKDRVRSLPIAAGMAELVDRVSTQKVPSFSAGSIEASLKVFFKDDVHLTRHGIYYAALLTYIGITGQTPKNAWRPEFISAEQASALQEVAVSFYQKRDLSYRPLSLAQCISHVTTSFCDRWNSYVPGKWAPTVRDCKPYFERQTSAVTKQFEEQNPFVFDAATEGTYWFPPP